LYHGAGIVPVLGFLRFPVFGGVAAGGMVAWLGGIGGLRGRWWRERCGWVCLAGGCRRGGRGRVGYAAAGVFEDAKVEGLLVRL
jgi:hypothetical protein